MADTTQETTSRSEDVRFVPLTVNELQTLARQPGGEAAFFQALDHQTTFAEQAMRDALTMPVEPTEVRDALLEAAHSALRPICYVMEHGWNMPSSPWTEYVRANLMLGDLYIIANSTFGDQTRKLKTPALLAQDRYGSAYKKGREGGIAEQWKIAMHAQQGMLAREAVGGNIDFYWKSFWLSARMYGLGRTALSALGYTDTPIPGTTEAHAILDDPDDAFNALVQQYRNL